MIIILIFSYFFQNDVVLEGTKRHKSSFPERETNKDVKILYYLRVSSVRCEPAHWEKVMVVVLSPSRPPNHLQGDVLGMGNYKDKFPG